MFMAKTEGDEQEMPEPRLGGPFDRYEVNVLVSHAGEDNSAPIVEELHPR